MTKKDLSELEAVMEGAVLRALANHKCLHEEKWNTFEEARVQVWKNKTWITRATAIWGVSTTFLSGCLVVLWKYIEAKYVKG